MLRQTLAGTSSGPSSPMVLEFDTSLGTTTISVPLAGTVNVVVDWGDGTSNTYTTTGSKTHTYASGGVYQVNITGTLTQFGIVSGTRPQFTKCLSFGTVGLTSLRGAFFGCANLIEVPATLPEAITALDFAFSGCTTFNYDISGWDVSNVVDMSGMFTSALAFNQDISGWNVANVTDMDSMFNNATSFNQNIGGWNMSNVSQAFQMFFGALAFNQDIGSWDVSKITDMSSMFSDASAFNQDIGAWDTVNVADMSFMFSDATNFNQDLTGWCVGNIQSEPSGFATGSALTTGNKPVWGTCPAYVADGAITYVGNATGTTSATLPSHQAGDLIVAFAFRDGSTTQPTQPSGWTSIDTATGTTCCARLAYKVAASGSETTGTWTNASTVIFVVYRDVDTTNITALDTEIAGVGTTVTYNANGFWKDLSRVIAFAAHRSIDTALGTAPTGLTLVVNPVDATDEGAAFESTIDNYGDWPSTNVSVGGTSSGWITFVMRLRVPIVHV